MLASPVVKHVSADSLETSLRQTRDAVVSLPERSDWVAPCGPHSGNPERQARGNETVPDAKCTVVLVQSASTLRRRERLI
jgi:hypothetical protein